ESFFILGYWEWTEDVLSRYGDILELCSVHDAIYASLYSNDRDTNILCAFCESWYPTTNTLHTMAGELSISLWDLYKLGGLPASGRTYNEAVPDIYTLCAHTDKGNRRILKACESLLIAYRQIVQRLEFKKGVFAQQCVDFWCKRSISYSDPVKQKRYTDAPPKSTHNPTHRVIHKGSGAKQIGPHTNELSQFTSFRAIWLLLGHFECNHPRGAGSLNVSYDKWTTVTIKDLKHNINKFCLAVESSSSNSKRISPHDKARDAHRSADGHASQYEDTGENICVAFSIRLHLTGSMAEVEGEDKSTSDVESKINFKHQKGRRSMKPRAADLEGNETDFWNAFDNILIPSDIPTDLTKVGDIDFEMGALFNIENAMIEEASEPLNVPSERIVPRKGKEIHIERYLVERSNPASPAQTHHYVDGPLTFEINAKTLSTPLDAKGIPRAPSHGDVVPTPLISTIRFTPASQGIFTSAIKILGNEHGEASQVYKAIRVMHSDPEPLKCKVDEYVWDVKGLLSLKASLSDRHRSDHVEEERLVVGGGAKLAESSYDAALTKHQGLEEESVTLKKKEDELLKELKDVRQGMNQMTNDIGDNWNSIYLFFNMAALEFFCPFLDT
ncbi:Serine/threonine-protein phosphatase 7 long form-like protein, partial [Bienertia sinuspersici]